MVGQRLDAVSWSIRVSGTACPSLASRQPGGAAQHAQHAWSVTTRFPNAVALKVASVHPLRNIGGARYLGFAPSSKGLWRRRSGRHAERPAERDAQMLYLCRF